MAEISANTKENELIEKISSKFKIEGKVQRERRVWVTIDKENLIDACNSIKELGFEHLSALSVTDWPEEGTFELTYHLWSYSDKILLTVKTKIDRAKPVISSVSPVWQESAQIHEREMHELFGVEFEGNEDLAPLFLEDWDGPPPFRKDFDWREHVKEKYYHEEDEREKGYWQELPEALYKEREPVPALAVADRITNFSEVELGYGKKLAEEQALRCLQCGEAPCIEACPAHLDVKKYVLETSEGNYKGAFETIIEPLPFPATCGRICPHPCEEACTLSHQFKSTTIREIKRFIADQFMDVDWYPKVKEKKEERVAVVGSGPAGLTVARNLAFSGYQITVFDSSPDFGGMLTQSVPEYRLPREIPTKEIGEIEKLGVKIEAGTLGKDFSIASLFEQGYKAIFVGIGAHRGMKMNIPGEDLEGVYEALDLLKDIKLGRKVPEFKGKRVVVVGGGNVAMDAVRSTLRLGADVTLVYRRSRVEMPAGKDEVEAADEEGIKINTLTNPTRIIGDKRVEEVECVRMELGEMDASGRRRPIPIQGSEFRIPVDIVIEAIGQSPVSEALQPMGVALERWGGIKVDDDMKTNMEGVYATGDVVTGPSIVIEAVAGGLKAAEAIEKYLQGKRE